MERRAHIGIQDKGTQAWEREEPSQATRTAYRMASRTQVPSLLRLEAREEHVR